MKDGTRLPVDEEEKNHLLQYDCQLLSYQQTAEWGMHTMQGSFGRLHIPLPTTVTFREIFLKQCQGCSIFVPIQLAITRSGQCICIVTEDKQEELWMSFEGMLFSEQQKNDRVGRFHLVASEY
jgi:hypothetical protein